MPLDLSMFAAALEKLRYIHFYEADPRGHRKLFCNHLIGRRYDAEGYAEQLGASLDARCRDFAIAKPNFPLWETYAPRIYPNANTTYYFRNR